MEGRKRIHIISHSHWDREWYMPLERHKMRLLDLIEANMELFETDPAFQSFHLDGQTIVLDDYLEICPQNREKLEGYIKEGKFRVGPFYILQDEFLTSAEANVRNLQTGMRDAQKYGNLTRVGYFPDAFGNAGQMPQLMNQAGMEAVVFGRGVKPVGFDNSLEMAGEYESAFSEMIWEAPDGTAMLGILFANWYNNGMEIPVEKEAAKKFWDRCINDAVQFAATDEILVMNGCDHQPLQKDISKALETARGLYPEIEFIHSDLETYVRSVKDAVEEQLSVVHGELTSQETNGWYTLVNTCSSHVYLKQLNRKNEVALEKVAEPLAAMAAVLGQPYPHERLQYAWKILMQNHPHDSICGCSVDQVNKEMEIRFDRSTEVAGTVADKAAAYLAKTVDTSVFEKFGEGCVPFVVMNTSGWHRSGCVQLVLDVKRDHGRFMARAYQNLTEWEMPSYAVVDARGNRMQATVIDAGVHFGYELPDDRFRKPYMARQVCVTVYVKNVPASGYCAYALVPAASEADENKNQECLAVGSCSMENRYLAVSINRDGTLNVLDKQLGRTYSNLCYYEDTLDAGNEYIYFCPEGNRPILTKATEAEVFLKENTPYRAVYEIVHNMTVPASADEQLKEQVERTVEFRYRKCGRSKKTVQLQLHTYVTLERDSRSVLIRTEFDNQARDHRLRVIVPTGLACSQHYAESVFEVVKRSNEHSRYWENPCKCEHQQSFVGMQDEKGGIMIANLGLYEYEILPDERNAMAVTLVRSVGELGDWGVFPTELSQQQRKMAAEYALTFFEGDLVEAEGFRLAHQFQIPWVTVQTDVHTGTLPAARQFLEWCGQQMAFSNMKIKDGAEDIMVRFYNCSKEDTVLYITGPAGFESLYFSNVVEEELRTLLPNEDNVYEIPVRGCEIVTVGLKR